MNQRAVLRCGIAMPCSYLRLLYLLIGVSVGCRGQETGKPPQLVVPISSNPDTLRDARRYLPKRPQIIYSDSLNRVVSYTAEGQFVDVNWAKITAASKSRTILKDSSSRVFYDEEGNARYLYKLRKNHAQIKEKFARIGFDIPIDKLNKTASIVYNTYFNYKNGFLYRYEAIYLHYAWQSSEDPYDAIGAHYIDQKIEVYNYKGEQIALIENNKLLVIPDILFAVSEDNRFTLIGTGRDIGEGQQEHDDFLLYDAINKKVVMITGIDDTKYDGIDCCIVISYFEEGVFKLIYNSGGRQLSLFIDPYKQKIYYRYIISAFGSKEIYAKNGAFLIPLMPDSSDREALSKYEITSF